MSVPTIAILRPDDWHVHLRDGDMMRAVLPATASLFGRAIVMPNLKPPVTSLHALAAYRQRIVAELPSASPFQPLMTLYLTDSTDPAEIQRGAEDGLLTAVKLYPAGATTNSDYGVTDFKRIDSVLAALSEARMPLLVHGEVADPDVDIFDREAVFIERVLAPMRDRFPELRIVLEHVTTLEGVQYVEENASRMGATITPHHLMINRTDIFRSGVRPHFYCLPIAKREKHRLALRAAATSGRSCFFLGTDSAPHAIHTKENDCGCAGIFNAPVAIACLAQVFEDERALDRLEAFLARNGPAFYRLPPNGDTITLERSEPDLRVFDDVRAGTAGRVKVFKPDQVLRWRVASGVR